ncbi:hypothetical protein DZC30_20365 [Comamonas testosteroni]|uniref:Uncharacterized protein n=1 Tax=Comamonas testosteroni TaxID=285 RepID=A0A373FAG1_COMTE|nr:hypothetical protein DZC30_20365 [Comamonas testosteroni]
MLISQTLRKPRLVKHRDMLHDSLLQVKLRINMMLSLCREPLSVLMRERGKHLERVHRHNSLFILNQCTVILVARDKISKVSNLIRAALTEALVKVCQRLNTDQPI